MPTIEVSYKDLAKLIGKEIQLKELEEEILLVKGEIEGKDDDLLKINIADTNRPDLWSAEGVAREIKIKKNRYKVKKSNTKVIVDKNLEGIRPKTVCAVVKNIKITPEVLSQLIQLQEKICETFGSKRKEVAIGVYDLDKIKSPVLYKAFRPEEISFTPLEFKEKLNLKQILEQHPKGKEYAYLLEHCDKYPIFIDGNNEVLSMPPIINSDYTGKVTETTKNLFIECSGFNFKLLMPALNVIVVALADRGGEIETVEINYGNRKIITPDLKEKEIELDNDYINKRSGLDLTKNEIIRLLKECKYDVKLNKNKLKLSYPSYRQDIMHQADVVEDVIIRYGYNNIKPVIPELATTGELNKLETFADSIADLMIGLGAQEILSYTLTNKSNLMENMNLGEQEIVEIENPVSKSWNVFRTWLIPGLLEFLSKNKNREYPQQIFEIGNVVLIDNDKETKTSNPIRLAWAKSSKDSNFTEAKQVLDFLMNTLDLKCSIIEIDHPSFIPGRVGRGIVNNKKVAYLGEINPGCLEQWNINIPTCCLEINLSELYKELNLRDERG